MGTCHQKTKKKSENLSKFKPNICDILGDWEGEVLFEAGCLLQPLAMRVDTCLRLDAYSNK